MADTPLIPLRLIGPAFQRSLVRRGLFRRKQVPVGAYVAMGSWAMMGCAVLPLVARDKSETIKRLFRGAGIDPSDADEGTKALADDSIDRYMKSGLGEPSNYFSLVLISRRHDRSTSPSETDTWFWSSLDAPGGGENRAMYLLLGDGMAGFGIGLHYPDLATEMFRKSISADPKWWELLNANSVGPSSPDGAVTIGRISGLALHVAQTVAAEVDPALAQELSEIPPDFQLK